MKQAVGAAVQVVGRDDFISCAGDVQQRHGDSRLPAGRRQRANPTVKFSHALFEHIGCGIHQARVDIAEFLEGKKIGGVIRVAKLV